MQFGTGSYAIEICNETNYSVGSADNVNSYGAVLSLEPQYRASSTYGIKCMQDGQTRSSIAIAASGGTTGIHSASCVVANDRCFVAVGYHIVCLRVPDLGVVWHVQGDLASCFGLYLTPDEQHFIVHGECEISKFTLEGHRVWEFSGRDIFTGPFAVGKQLVDVVDFCKHRYRIDIESGAEMVVDAG